LNDPAKHELLKLVQNEIDLGFTFLNAHHLSCSEGHMEHARQALQKAEAAWRAGTRFLNRLTEEEASTFRPGLRELESAIHAETSSTAPEISQ
jgi:hypothetical protein